MILFWEFENWILEITCYLGFDICDFKFCQKCGENNLSDTNRWNDTHDVNFQKLKAKSQKPKANGQTRNLA